MSKQLKILQITNRIPYPLNDGGNLATYNVTKSFHEMGHRVVLASLNTTKHFQDPKVVASVAEVHTTSIDTTITPWGMLIGLFSKTPYNIARFYSKVFETLLVDLVKKEQPDIIQFEGIYLAIYCSTLRKHSNAPMVLRSHNIEHEIWKRTAENEGNFLKKKYLNLLSKQIQNFEEKQLHQFDVILAITDKDAAYYSTHGFKGKLRTLSAGVDLGQYPIKTRDNESISLSFLGSMEWMPNVQGIEWFLKEVWPGLVQKIPSLTIHIAGKSMSEEMKGRKISGVSFHGMVPNAVEFLRQHAIMIVPLLSGGGMRLKIIEAMALQCCVVSTSIGAEGIEAKQGESILIADSPEAIHDQLIALITNPAKIKSIGNQARVLVEEKYSWEKLVRELEKFYLELI